MQDLTVIGVENGALVVSSDDGERFRIVIDELLQSRLRQGIVSAQSGKKVSPREIQMHIRAGLSAFEVAELTGAAVDYVERFEGPVVAERQFIVESALRVAVQPTTPADPLGEEQLSTFGDAIDERLESLTAADVRWASWKDESGWIVKLTFTSREIDHDARWQFDPKRHVLTPLNNEATTLSRNGELTEGLIPRLRAVSTRTDDDDTRFDSGAFSPLERVPAPDGLPSEPVRLPAGPDDEIQAETPEIPAAPAARAPKEATRPFDAFNIKRAPDDADTADHNQTADLLEALRRRRGEREAAAFEPSVVEEPTAFGGPRAVEPHRTEPEETPVDVPLDGFGLLGIETETPAPPAPAAATPPAAPSPASNAPKPASAKRQRAAMPSWDEIVFGARTDDDPA